MKLNLKKIFIIIIGITLSLIYYAFLYLISIFQIFELSKFYFYINSYWLMAIPSYFAIICISLSIIVIGIILISEKPANNKYTSNHNNLKYD